MGCQRLARRAERAETPPSRVFGRARHTQEEEMVVRRVVKEESGVQGERTHEAELN